MDPLRDVELRHLTALVAVADHGTFGKAAHALGFTQSAVSQQIASLEKVVGLPVFDRPKGPKPAELTPAGRLILAHARTVAGQVSTMADELDRLRRGISGRLTIGTFQSVSAELLPRIIQTMRAEVPQVEIRLFETDDQTALIDGVMADELDLAFTVDTDGDPRLETVLLGYDPFVVIAAVGDLPGPTASPADLDRQPLIGEPEGNVCQALIARRLDGAGIHPDYVFRSQDNGAVQGMVRAGMGRAVVPYLAIDPDDPGIEVFRLVPPIEPRTMYLTRRADHSLPPVADQFTTIACAVADDVLQPGKTLAHLPG